MDYKIRIATPNDHDLIYRLKAESVRPYVEKIWGWDEDYQKKDFDSDFSNIEQFHVIEIDNSFVGFVQYYFEYPYFEVVEIHLLPECRGKGIGSNILRYLQKVCVAQDRKIRIGCFKENHRAKQLYQKLGFIQTEETDTHFIMEFVNVNEKSPENQLYIYEKPITPTSFDSGILKPLTKESAEEISNWEYESPYEVYNFKGHPDDWLMDESTWGTEQFCLVEGNTLLGQVACQLDGKDLWVGWSMAPQFCGKGNGSNFVNRCVRELREFTGHTGRILLRVAAWNQRAIRAYQKVGFSYVETIQDEIAYTNHMEDFWVMELQ